MARNQDELPLCYSAGKAIEEVVRRKAPVLLLTGFPVPSPFSKEKPAVHSDGPVGIASMIRRLTGKFGLEAIVVTDLGLGPIMKSSIVGGMAGDFDESRITILELPKDRDVKDQCSDILSLHSPGIIIASEKPGRNSVGEYHTAFGKRLTSFVSWSDSLFEVAREMRTPTVAVADLGNDVGMGNIQDVIGSVIPSEMVCACPCKSGIITSISCDHLVVSTMCDWGVYGILTYLAITFSDFSLVPKPSEMIQIMSSFAKTSNLSDVDELMTDGIPLEYTGSCLSILSGIAKSQK